MSRYNKDPRPIVSKYPGKCSQCQSAIKKSAPAYYWPSTKTVMCPSCGLPQYNEFLSTAQDEDYYNGAGNCY
jgi:hypothetical protein